jgi:DNA-binding beta-propeller fold protein YncE
MTLGDAGRPSDTGYAQKSNMYESLATIIRGGPPFNRPTGVDVNSAGEIYVSDGYGNARVHKFSPQGELLFSWGEPGTGPGQFRLPHSIWVDKEERVWVTDWQNNRIQIFDAQGRFLTQWTDLAGPSDVCIDDEETVYVSEEERRLSIFSIDGKLLGRWDSQGEADETALFIAPHAVAVDSRGDLYVGEVSKTFAGVDKGLRTLQKFARCQ